MVTSEPHVTIAEVERQEVDNKGRQGTKKNRFDPEAILKAMKDHYLLVLKVVLLVSLFKINYQCHSDNFF